MPMCFQPRDRPPPPDEGPLPADDQMLVRFFGRLVARLTASERDALTAWSFGQTCKTNSMCSGTEVPSLICDALAQALQEHGSTFSVHAEFAVEVNSAKRSFIAKVFPSLKHIFHDVTELHKGLDRDHLAGNKKVAVPTMGQGWLFIGYPCTTVSLLNPQAHTLAHRGAVRSGSLKTGKVFKGLLDYLDYCMENDEGRAQRNVPDIIFLENVKNLGAENQFINDNRGDGEMESNLQASINLLEAYGFCVVPFLLQPSLFGNPQSRNRIWMVALSSRQMQCCGLSADAVKQSMEGLMARMVGHAAQPLDFFLLPEQDALVQQHYEQFRDKTSSSSQPCKRKHDGMPKWVDKHIEAFNSTGKCWWRSDLPDPALLDFFPGLRALNARHLQLIRHLGISIPSSDHCTLDVSQSLGRCKPSKQ